jgi:hypothetical protein
MYNKRMSPLLKDTLKEPKRYMNSNITYLIKRLFFWKNKIKNREKFLPPQENCDINVSSLIHDRYNN